MTKTFAAIGGMGALAAMYLVSRLNIGNMLDVFRPVSYWRILAIIVALLNLKSLPFAWHYRLLRGLLAHVTLGRTRPVSPGPSALFQPLIISSRTSLWETDYNLHRSNSTYFSDLDIARMHLVTCLLKTGLHKAHYEKPVSDSESRYSKEGGGGRLGIMLGGVACDFKREIRPYEGYEIWTRVLSWDRKWLYLISHIIKKGAIKPAGYSQQPWRKGRTFTPSMPNSSNEAVSRSHGAMPVDDPSAPHPAIFATSIAKYVFKSGRKTIPPEIVLLHAELLPSKAEGTKEALASASPAIEATELPNETAKAAADSIASLTSEQVVTSAEDAASRGAWTWDRIEAERIRGMKLAQHFAELNGLHGEFTADSREALGEW